MPETSIIIRTYNEEKHLGNLLRAIAKQDYKNYEIIVVDSGSSDGTLEIAEKFKVKVIKIESRDFTFGYALNVGCRASSGDYLVFASAHILPVADDWLSALLRPFADQKVALVYGRQMGSPVSKFSEQRDFKRLFPPVVQNVGRPLDYANNANAAIRRKLWEKRPFDEYLFGLEDIDWAKDMTKQGYLVHYEPTASIFHIHEEAWHQVFNRYRREAIAAYRIGLPHPPQARIGWGSLLVRLASDVLASFPHWSPARLEEILRFRYYQWKGSRQGWLGDKDIDFRQEKYDIFFPLKNQSVVITGKERARLAEVPLPEMKPGDILIEVNYVGICRTDLEILNGTLGYYRDGLANYPIVPGHEFSGTIIRVGANNKYRERFKIGQKVVGECILSRGGEAGRKEVGVINYNGAYSKYIVMPGDAIHQIPKDIDLQTAALTEPLAVILRALRRIENRLTPKARVAVLGAGPIGNLCAQVLAQADYRVSVFDKNPKRLSLLKTQVYSTHTDLENLGDFNVIIEATGSKDVLEQVIKDSRNDSTLMLLGFPYGDISYNFEDLAGYEKVFAGSVGGDQEDFRTALKLLPKLETKPFRQKTLPLEEFEKAWEIHRSAKYLKVMLTPQKTAS